MADEPQDYTAYDGQRHGWPPPAGWWQASDGRYYPAESHPNHQQQPLPPPPGVPPPTMPMPAFDSAAERPFWQKKRVLIPVALLGLLIIIGIAAGGGDDAGDQVGTDFGDQQAAEPKGEPVTSQAATGRPEPEEQAAEPDEGADDDREFTESQRNAVRSAESYIDFSSFSRQGLIDQLSSDFGDQFPVEDATIAVDSLDIDWNEQAARSAEAYLEFSSFSCAGLIDQLSSDFGDQYTVEQATFGANSTGLC